MESRRLTYGGGAMGALYSWINFPRLPPRQFHHGLSVQHSTVQSSGFTIDFFAPGKLRPQKVIRDASELACPIDPTKSIVQYDLIFVCAKASSKLDIPAYVITPRKTAIYSKTGSTSRSLSRRHSHQSPLSAQFSTSPVTSSSAHLCFSGLHELTHGWCSNHSNRKGCLYLVWLHNPL